jgi:predicted lysophospholipase L1 biosynthesis ABC-type transport system permease subunit
MLTRLSEESLFMELAPSTKRISVHVMELCGVGLQVAYVAETAAVSSYIKNHEGIMAIVHSAGKSRLQMVEQYTLQCSLQYSS